MTIHRLSRLNFETQTRALERLSSGLRINRAADDAAGLSISESFTSQVRGTYQAIRNVQDGISLLRTAEGAFGNIHDVLQRMRELAVQGANGTLALGDRAAIQAELDQLKAQIDQTAYHTSFNEQKLLADPNKVLQPRPMPYTYQSTGTAIGGWTNATVADARLTAPGMAIDGVTYEELQSAKAQVPTWVEGARRKVEDMLFNSGLDYSAITPELNVSFVIDAGFPGVLTTSDANNVVVNLYAFYGTGVPGSNPNVTIEQAVTQAMAFALMQREDQRGSSSAVGTDVASFYSTLNGQYDNIRQFFHMGAGESYLGYGKPAAFNFDTLDATDGGRANAAWFYRYLLENHGQEAIDGFTRTIVENDSGNKGAIAAALDTYLLDLTGEASRADLEAAVGAWIATQPNPAPFSPDQGLANTGAPKAQRLNEALTLQIGANAGQVLDVTLFAGAIGNLDFVGMVNVMDQGAAGRSIATLDKAIAMVSDARTQLGANENRLEHTLNRLATYAENAQAARSTLRDTDVANEMSQNTRAAIMAQASTAMLRSYHRFQADQVSALLGQ